MASASTSRAPGTARKPPLYCLGCGSDISNRSADRRSLQSDAAEHIIPVWKSLLEDVVSQGESDVDIDADSLVSGGGDPTQCGKMCRKCFGAYDRYKSLQTLLTNNLRAVVDVVVPTTSSPKRPRLESSATTYTCATSASRLQLQLATSSTTVSPEVAVS